MPRRLGRDTGLAPQLDGLVYPNRDRGDERQAQYSEPLPAVGLDQAGSRSHQPRLTALSDTMAKAMVMLTVSLRQRPVLFQIVGGFPGADRPDRRGRLRGRARAGTMATMWLRSDPA